MEELQSTEVLDREILEDARKKALRILKTCEETIYTQNSEWEEKKLNAAGALDKKYGKQKDQEIINIMARLPVDKLRVKIEKIEELLKSAAESWYSGLNRDQILELLTSELSARLSYCKNQIKESGGFSAEISALEQKEAKKILKSVSIIYPIPASISLRLTNQPFPSITLMAGDIRITASIEKAMDFILQEKREELAGALVGHDFLESA